MVRMILSGSCRNVRLGNLRAQGAAVIILAVGDHADEDDGLAGLRREFVDGAQVLLFLALGAGPARHFLLQHDDIDLRIVDQRLHAFEIGLGAGQRREARIERIAENGADAKDLRRACRASLRSAQET